MTIACIYIDPLDADTLVQTGIRDTVFYVLVTILTSPAGRAVTAVRVDPVFTDGSVFTQIKGTFVYVVLTPISCVPRHTVTDVAIHHICTISKHAGA